MYYPVNVTDGRRNSANNRRMSANRFLGMATSDFWNAAYRHWLATFAPILTSFSLRLVSDQSSTGSGMASVRRKLRRGDLRFDSRALAFRHLAPRSTDSAIA